MDGWSVVEVKRAHEFRIYLHGEGRLNRSAPDRLAHERMHNQCISPCASVDTHIIN